MFALGAGSFFDQYGMSTLGTWSLDGRIPDRVITIRILVAGIKKFSATRAFFHQFTFAAFPGAFDSGRKGFGVLAVRVVGAGNKAASGTGMLDDQVTVLAIGTFADNLRRRCINNLDFTVIIALEILDVATIRVACTTEEFTATGTLDSHGASAFFAGNPGLFRRLFLKNNDLAFIIPSEVYNIFTVGVVGTARNSPVRPNLMTMGEPHLSQVIPVSSPPRFISLAAISRVG